MNIAIPSDNLQALDILRFRARFIEPSEDSAGFEDSNNIQDQYIAEKGSLSEDREIDSSAEPGPAADNSECLGKAEPLSAQGSDKSSASTESDSLSLPPDESAKAAENYSERRSAAPRSSVPEFLSMDGGPLFSVSLREPEADYENGFIFFASEPQEDVQKELPPSEGGDRPAPVRRTAGRSSSKRADPMGEKEEAALKEELRQQDELRADEIYERMRIDRQIHEAKLQAMLADLQTELQRIWREAALRRRKMEDDLSKSWQKAVLGV